MGSISRVLSTVELVTANVHDSRTLGQVLAGMDAVINLVGILNESGHATFQSVHADLAAKLVAAARGAKVPRLLQMSAAGADQGARAEPLSALQGRGGSAPARPQRTWT